MADLLTDVPSFDTEADAFAWMDKQVDDPCVDNHRFAFLADHPAVENFWEKSNEGCCGSFNKSIIVAGKHALIGCNYGH